MSCWSKLKIEAIFVCLRSYALTGSRKLLESLRRGQRRLFRNLRSSARFRSSIAYIRNSNHPYSMLLRCSIRQLLIYLYVYC